MIKNHELQNLVRDLVDEMNSALRRIEDCRDALEHMEEFIAGINANYFNSVERLTNSASSALEEAIAWVKEIK